MRPMIRKQIIAPEVRDTVGEEAQLLVAAALGQSMSLSLTSPPTNYELDGLRQHEHAS